MSAKIPLAQYIFRRLRQHGVRVMHGVPGDFTLKALDLLAPSGIKWIGNCNELNAAYAADGYARIAGMGALLTTYGVGELSAINSVAGSQAERVPVIHIVGYPQRYLLNESFRIHHGLNNGRNGTFAEVHSKILQHAWMLDSEDNAVSIIDQALEDAVKFSRPQYVALPCDMATSPVSAAPLEKPLQSSETDHLPETQRAVGRLLDMFYKSKSSLILVDRSSGMDALRHDIHDFVQHSGIPTLTLPSGAGIIDHSLSNYYGVHAGPVGQIDTTKYVSSADFVFCLGPMFSDTQTLGWSILPDHNVTVELHCDSIYFHMNESKHSINAKSLLRTLTKTLEPSKLAKSDVASLGNFRNIPSQYNPHDTGPINQTSLYHRLNRYLRPHDIILLAIATPILGARDFVLPDPSCRVIASGMWFSIGHMLPAALGAALAQQQNPQSQEEGRVILLEGDGSFQTTAQELSTIIHHRLNMTIFIINNGGYAYERLIHGLNEKYNDIAPWDYLALPAAFGAQKAMDAAKDAGEEYSVDTICLRTNAELEDFLKDEKFDNGTGGRATRGLKLIDVRVGRDDVPDKFRPVFERAGETLGASSSAKRPKSLLARNHDPEDY